MTQEGSLGIGEEVTAALVECRPTPQQPVLTCTFVEGAGVEITWIERDGKLVKKQLVKPPQHG